LKLRTCVNPGGSFTYTIHKPSIQAANYRQQKHIMPLGRCGKEVIHNKNNFPQGNIRIKEGAPVYEIANAFPFKGASFINSPWAEKAARMPESIRLPKPPSCSFSKTIKKWLGSIDENKEDLGNLFQELPEPVLLSLATTSDDPDDLCRLARLSVDFDFNDSGNPQGLIYEKNGQGLYQSRIHHRQLFEAVANNPALPDQYKRVMVLNPGAQGGSEIVGEYLGNSHVFEYLRRNSYIPWGHYAANMAHDTVRYSIEDLKPADLEGMRHLYYQRTFSRLAESAGFQLPRTGGLLTTGELEELRKKVLNYLKQGNKIFFNSTLWGWNYGFDFAPSGNRLHASHQQIHQQFALTPDNLDLYENGEPTGKDNYQSYSCGDLIREFLDRYRQETGSRFFDDYQACIRSNQRMDGRDDRQASLIIHEDEHVILFVPKAQTSQWELQLMTRNQVGNILEAGPDVRQSLDYGILSAVGILSGLGAKMITSIEYPKRLDNSDRDQRLIYVFLPRLPHSPGAFSEAQLRWIMGHFPEDFATACRTQYEMQLRAC